MRSLLAQAPLGRGAPAQAAAVQGALSTVAGRRIQIGKRSGPAFLSSSLSLASRVLSLLPESSCASVRHLYRRLSFSSRSSSSSLSPSSVCRLSPSVLSPSTSSGSVSLLHSRSSSSFATLKPPLSSSFASSLCLFRPPQTPAPLLRRPFATLPPPRFAASFFSPSASVSHASPAASSTLKHLQEQALRNPSDPACWMRYFQALNSRGDSREVVRQFEENLLVKQLSPEQLRGDAATASALHGVVAEYLKALCACDGIHSHALSALARDIFPLLSAETSTSPSRRAEARTASSAARDVESEVRLLQLNQLQLLLQQLQHLSSQLAQERTKGDAGVPGRHSQSAAVELGEQEAKSRARGVLGWTLFALHGVFNGVWRTFKVGSAGLWSLLLSPIAAVLLIWSFATEALPDLQQAAKKAEGLPEGKSREWVQGKIVQPDQVKTSFNDVKGCEEVKKEVEEVVAYLKSPEKFTAMGARLPKGILLQGPPGTGKTLLARAIAGEAGVPFLHASGSEFEEMFVGVGASRLRQLFAEARRLSPCILFIDEIDALGGKRTLTENKHHRQTLNQLLTELDGFNPSDGVTLVCATNLLEALDPALTRPGRIDRIIHVPFPSKKERIEILKHYAKEMPLAADVDLEALAGLTSGMTGADLSNLLNFAAIRAATEGKEQVTRAEVDESFDRLMVGSRRTGVVMKEEERRLTAYHESGHALVALYTPASAPLHKATILFRGSSLGVTWSVEKEDTFSQSEQQCLASLDVAMGGKAAEELTFGAGKVTSGCRSDLVRATQLARAMVTNYGMGFSDSKAPMVIGRQDYLLVSDEKKSRVDEAVQKLLDESYARARRLLEEKRDELTRLAEALLEHETLSAEEVRLAVAGKLRARTRVEAQQTADEAGEVLRVSSSLSNVEERKLEKRSAPGSASTVEERENATDRSAHTRKETHKETRSQVSPTAGPSGALAPSPYAVAAAVDVSELLAERQRRREQGGGDPEKAGKEREKKKSEPGAGEGTAANGR
ncbi:UNVERIFIED_CONTAM: ATP-dependent metallopeptidase HflB subfamily protein [Hammondia hammondi]|eukprot:XP_008888409.1 ATP-dependent metallopeptidase HflB subfamily protein [Hammondia hammondi]